MQEITIYYTLWFAITVACIWDMRRSQLESKRILEHIAEIQRDIARYLGTDRR